MSKIFRYGNFKLGILREVDPWFSYSIAKKGFIRNKYLRKVSSKDPFSSYHYASEIDRGPHEVTREGASKNPERAFFYAHFIDKGPHKVTRKGASKDPYWSALYARDIDKEAQ